VKKEWVMFTVGEFSRLAQVSKRLLRYYDEIGLLKPVHTDPMTGYRYYKAEQLPHLNRILALKDLGLSLDQIQRVLHDNISTDEMQGMLLLKKAEVEQQLQTELQRIRNIESRLTFIRNSETGKPLDVVVKQIPAQPVLSLRMIASSFEEGMVILGQMMSVLPLKNPYGLFFVIWYSGGPFEPDSDVEAGRLIQVKDHAPVALQNGLQLSYRELPPVPMMATFVASGPVETMHVGYSAIGIWAENNGYRFAGEPREIALQLPGSVKEGDWLTEIQYPVEMVRPT
jgi:DNA-binding transcriptional MerR regulator/effector-binding domain-containing protein